MVGLPLLLNLFVRIVHADDAIIQADDVYAIFFDVLALELVQKLDDVAQCAGKSLSVVLIWLSS